MPANDQRGIGLSRSRSCPAGSYLFTAILISAVLMPGDLYAYVASSRAPTTALLVYIEGSLGALTMVAAGFGALAAACAEEYRSAAGLLLIAMGVFVLRAMTSTFFNDGVLSP